MASKSKQFYKDLEQRLPEQITKEKAMQLCPSYQTANYLPVQYLIWDSKDNEGMIKSSTFVDYLEQGDRQGEVNRQDNDAKLSTMKPTGQTSQRFGLNQSRDH